MKTRHNYRLKLPLFTLIGGLFLQAEQPYTPGHPVDKDFDSFAADFIEFHCFDCHGDGMKKGDLSLEDLGPIDETNADLWKSIWAQVAIEEMPPKKKDQPEKIERLEFTDWVLHGLENAMKDKGGFHSHKAPKKGNFISHDLLFGDLPENLALQPPSSPKRIWRITPEEHITRLNELINTEPKYDPNNPGLRTHGDAVPVNHGGELKLYFGVDRINSWAGGTVAYATSVKSIPVVLAAAQKHGFQNYAHFSTINSAESTQILTKAVDILKYMAHGPESLINDPDQITDDPAYYMIKHHGVDIRGGLAALTYNKNVVRPLTPLSRLLNEDKETYGDEDLREVIQYLFEMLTFRPPTEKETNNYLGLVKETMAQVDGEEGLFMGLSAIFLDRDALFYTELARNGKEDPHGRVMLQDWELGNAVNRALRYLKPDPKLREAIVTGRMRTKEDVQREITRMMADDSIRKPRILQFFREYFDYNLAGYVCKDEKALKKTKYDNKSKHFQKSMLMHTASTDRLIESILMKDKQVLKEMLTTQENIKAEDITREERIKLIQLFNTKKYGQASGYKAKVIPSDPSKTYARVGHRSFGRGSLQPERTLQLAPEGQRLGVLTQPSWLVSHSDAMDNHAIHRGIWVRERLLGGGIPDVPITVDAQLPDEPDTPLRHRMRVTREQYCWSCHEKMDPLGLTFEMYDHAGFYRTTELGDPVDTSGEIIDSGDPALDGPVTDAHDMITKLANSERVEQVFVRHAFRFWMGRNETIHDRPVLQAAHKAYRESEGSMKALITSLVTSDAFLYRK